MAEDSEAGQIRWLATPLVGMRALWLKSYRHALDFYTESFNFVALEECRSEVSFRNTRFAAPSTRTCVLAPDGVLRHVRMPAPETLKVLYIDKEVVDRAWQELVRGGAPTPGLLLSRDETLFDSLLWLHQGLLEHPSELELQMKLQGIVERWATEAGRSVRDESGASSQALKAAHDLLCDRFDEPISIDELATAARLSRFHFVRAFKRAFGVPPHTYQNQLRVARASRWLRAGASASEAAQAAGFFDQTHLNRHFSRCFGVSAGAYARSTRPGPSEP